MLNRKHLALEKPRILFIIALVVALYSAFNVFIFVH